MKQLTKNLVAKRLQSKVQFLLRTKPVKIIAVTGSIGKTSTQIAIGQVLATKYHVTFNDNSYNTDIGLPLAFFGLEVPSRLPSPLAWRRIFKEIAHRTRDFTTEVVVLELADDELDSIGHFVQAIRPNMCVITAVAPVHLEKLKTMERVVDDNWQLGLLCKQLIYNADFKLLAQKAKNSKKFISYGITKGDYRFRAIKRNRDGTLTTELKIGTKYKIVRTKQVSKQGLYSLLAAAAVGHKFRLTVDEIVHELENIVPMKGRMNLLPGVRGAKLLDDSYNSSPDASLAALDTLADFKTKGRKIAVLGSMNELGSFSQEGHSLVGQRAAHVADLLVVIGKEAERWLAPAAIEAGLTRGKVKIFRTPYEAGHYLKTVATPGDTVLIKGSQNGVFAEEVTRILLRDDIDPEAVLVRQSPVWKKRKKKAFAI